MLDSIMRRPSKVFHDKFYSKIVYNTGAGDVTLNLIIRYTWSLMKILFLKGWTSSGSGDPN